MYCLIELQRKLIYYQMSIVAAAARGRFITNINQTFLFRLITMLIYINLCIKVVGEHQTIK